MAEISWLRQLVHEIHFCPRHFSVVFYDNVSVVYLSTNPVQHQRTKHVKIDLHLVRNKVATGEIRVLHVPSTSQYADVFSKDLPTSIFTKIAPN
jgi:hypothetical protein